MPPGNRPSSKPGSAPAIRGNNHYNHGVCHIAQGPEGIDLRKQRAPAPMAAKPTAGSSRASRFIGKAVRRLHRRHLAPRPEEDSPGHRGLRPRHSQRLELRVERPRRTLQREQRPRRRNARRTRLRREGETLRLPLSIRRPTRHGQTLPLHAHRSPGPDLRAGNPEPRPRRRRFRHGATRLVRSTLVTRRPRLLRSRLARLGSRQVSHGPVRQPIGKGDVGFDLLTLSLQRNAAGTYSRARKHSSAPSLDPSTCSKSTANSTSSNTPATPA